MFHVFLKTCIVCNLLVYQHSFDTKSDKVNKLELSLRRMFVKDILYSIDHCTNKSYLPNL